MKEWKEYRLGEMIQCNPQIKLEKGKSYNLIDIDSIEIGSRYVKGKELTEYDGQSGCHFQNGDTVMARITPCLENGKIAQVHCESKKGFGSTELFVFRGTENKTDSDYVFNLMSMQFIRNLAANSMTGASGRQRADLGFIKRIKWNFPPLPTQQKIASILSAYDNLIQNYKKQIETLQTAASELYKEWFVRFRFPGYQTTEFENGIPEGWKVEKIGEYCNIRIGGDVPEKNSEIKDEKHKYPIFSSGINEDGLYGFTDTFKISEPSVTISARGTVGFVCLRREPYYPIVRLICLIPRKELGVFYLYHSLKYADLDGNGTSQQQLTAPMVSKRKIMIAEEKLIEKFNLNAKIIYNKIDLLKIQITNLTQQRDLLLPRLMSGKLEVE